MELPMTDYGPSIKAARLYEKTSKNGNTYFVGRWGALKVTVLKSKATGDNGESIWDLLLSEAPPKADSSDRARQRQPIAKPEATSKRPPDSASRLDDPIPFRGDHQVMRAKTVRTNG
jgi:hypothetical protein